MPPLLSRPRRGPRTPSSNALSASDSAATLSCASDSVATTPARGDAVAVAATAPWAHVTAVVSPDTGQQLALPLAARDHEATTPRARSVSAASPRALESVTTRLSEGACGTTGIGTPSDEKIGNGANKITATVSMM